MGEERSEPRGDHEGEARGEARGELRSLAGWHWLIGDLLDFFFGIFLRL